MRQIARALVIGVAALVLLPAGSPCQTRTQGPAGGNALRLSSQAIETLVRRVAPSVVQVMVSGFQQQEQTVRGGTDVTVRRGKTIGSGVVIDPGGYILTNAHVIEGAERIEVILAPGVLAGEPGPDQRQLEARVIGKDDAIDLALLSIDAHDLPALPLADYTKARQGQLVWAFGSPGGLLNSVSMGVVSAVARRIEPASPVVWLQTDAAVNPGSSGGPLVNADGEILGLNTFIHSVSGGSEGLGFALPSGIIAQAYPQLRQYGHLHRAILGFTAQLITPALKKGLNLATDAGVIVADLAEGGPAGDSPLSRGDVILAVNAALVTTPAELRAALSNVEPAGSVVLHIERNGVRSYVVYEMD